MIENKITELRDILTGVNNRLLSLTNDNFSVNLETAKSGMIKVDKLRNSLKNEYSYDELKKYDEEMTLLAKQIQVTFDNIIRDFRNKQDSILNEIVQLQNKKKLIKYGR